MINKDKIQKVLVNCWSSETSSKWTESNPALGQCSVTALVIHDFYGGRLLKTKVNNTWHFYNEIEDHIYDFTSSQFTDKIKYTNESAKRYEVLSDTSIEQYKILYKKFSEQILA